MNSIPISYGGAEIVKVSVTFTYDYYSVVRANSGEYDAFVEELLSNSFSYNDGAILGTDFGINLASNLNSSSLFDGLFGGEAVPFTVP